MASAAVESSFRATGMNSVSPQPEASCPICGGSGWRSIVQGKERKVVRCECRTKIRGERLLAAAKIPRRYEHCELSTFKYDPEDKEQKSLENARHFANRFVEEYPVEKTGLLFVGTVGVGKTHLAVGILKVLIRDKGVPCLFCDYREVLVLDELGAVHGTEWVFDTVNYILNSRYNDNKTTIITTNFPDKPERGQVEDDNPRSYSAAERAARRETLGDRIGERMRSRLHEMCKKVEMEGHDYRLHSKTAKFHPIEAPARIKVRGKKEGG